MKVSVREQRASRTVSRSFVAWLAGWRDVFGLGLPLGWWAGGLIGGRRQILGRSSFFILGRTAKGVLREEDKVILAQLSLGLDVGRERGERDDIGRERSALASMTQTEM